MKLLGVYDPGPNPPVWARIGTLADFATDAMITDAVRLSRERGMVWLLQMGYQRNPAEPIEAHAAAVKARLEALGVYRYIAAVCLGEEWYAKLDGGVFASFGLPPGTPWGRQVVCNWLSRQHAAIRSVMPDKWLAWVTTAVTPDWPVPEPTDLVLVDAYVPDGETFDRSAKGILETTEQSTHLPLVLIVQAFTHPQSLGPHWQQKPTPEDTSALLGWMASRPRYVAGLLFTWQSRPNGITGLEHLPDTRRVVESFVA